MGQFEVGRGVGRGPFAWLCALVITTRLRERIGHNMIAAGAERKVGIVEYGDGQAAEVAGGSVAQQKVGQPFTNHVARLPVSS